MKQKTKFIPSNLVYYVYIKEPDGNVETVTLTQNLEAADHLKIEFSLSRWRTKKLLTDYLRNIADIVESLDNACNTK